MDIFRLDTARTSFVLTSVGGQVPRLLHFGRRLSDDLDAQAVRRLQSPPIIASVPDPPPVSDEPPGLSMFPEHGAGFFGQPALLGSRGGDDFLTEFALTGADASEHALTLTLEDDVAALSLTLEYMLLPDCDVLCARTHLTNRGAAPYGVEWLAALSLKLPERFGELMTLGGRWAGEFQTDRYPLPHPIQIERTSRYGRTGHGSSPTLFVGEAGFCDTGGSVMGLHLGWSGNHRVLVEVRRDGSRHAQLGEWLLPGEVAIAPGATLTTPWVHAAWSSDGLNGVSEAFHTFLRRHHLPPQVAKTPRPVILNTWEAVYFDHDVATLKDIATAAAEVGVERFVLDDGWFGQRDNPERSLGDWWVDPRKYPDGLTPLIDHVTGLGMEFGLWVEPEMVNPDSDLYRAHPDWCLSVTGRERPTQRSQLTLDLTQRAAWDHVFQAISRLLAENAIGYLKWDHNRDLAPPASRGRPAAREQTLALYALLDRLRQAHPGVEIESCASGGGRADFGVLSRTERFWPSDNNDAHERVGIQRGASLLFPLEVIGAHVGAVPSHQTGRSPPIGFRARTALFGHFGMELDPRRLDESELAELKAHVALYKRFRALLHSGTLLRFSLGDPGGFGQLVRAGDGGEALVQLLRLDQAPFAHTAPVRLPGLDPAARYRVELVEPWPQPAASHLSNAAFWREEPVVTGEALGEIGLRLPLALPQTIWLIHLQRL